METKVLNDLTIVILSCREFSDLWSNNLMLLNRYWPNHPKTYLISDGPGKFDMQEPSELIVIPKSMSSRIIDSLSFVKTKYVFLTLDDYLIKNRVDEKKICLILQLMESINLDYCRLFRNKQIKGRKQGSLKYKNLPLRSVYEVNFYPSIWKKDTLKSVIVENEDIWKTEVRLTRRMRENSKTGIAIYNAKIFPFMDCVRKGKYLISSYRCLKKLNLFVSERKVRSHRETFNLFVKTFVSNHLPGFLKVRLKKKLSKKGHIFYSDYEYDEKK